MAGDNTISGTSGRTTTAADRTTGAGDLGLEHDIAETRQRLGETIDQLGAKFDMQAQARTHKPQLAVVAAVVASVAALLIWRRRR